MSDQQAQGSHGPRHNDDEDEEQDPPLSHRESQLSHGASNHEEAEKGPTIKAPVFAVLAQTRLRGETGSSFAAIDLFVNRLLLPRNRSIHKITTRAIKLLYDSGVFKLNEQDELSCFEKFKATAREHLRNYSYEMRRPLNEVTLLAFVFFCQEENYANPDWDAISKFFDIESDRHRSKYYTRVREIVARVSDFEIGAVHIGSEKDFTTGTCLDFISHICKDVDPPMLYHREYRLDTLRGKYFARTPWQYVLLTYVVIIGSIVITAILIVIWKKPLAEGIVEALQVVPLLDLLYFGLWKVFSYNDKFVRDLLTGRWTIDSVADLLNYYNLELEDLYRFVFFDDYKLGELLQPRFLSFANVPLIGLLAVDRPAPARIFSAYMSHFTVGSNSYVVDWHNKRVGSFNMISSTIGRIMWVYSNDRSSVSEAILRKDYKPPLSSTTASTVEQLIFESDITTVCECIG